MNTAYDNRAALFWLFQIAGWLGYGAFNFVSSVMILDRNWLYWYPTTVYIVSGFVLTLVMRATFRAMREKSAVMLALVVIVEIAVASILFSMIQVWAYTTLYPIDWVPVGLWVYIKDAPYTSYIFIAWTGLYFGIGNYLELQQQKEKTLRASALAHQAQLKMLRYQLNPHFLFNTLNAISTLVLDKDVVSADRMLGKLSAFLRSSLVNEPTQKVTLEQELQTLELYLEIEKTRFQKRLRIKFVIAERARDALLPSLLLQPLIENAIKYAVAPREEGGSILLQAEISAGELCITLEDDGPGLPANPVKAVTKKSSGVGLVNTRERLQQLYGPGHSMRLINLSPRGLRIVICLPAEFGASGGRAAGSNSEAEE